ncbi:MAG TPA: zinc ribbon domain-containing protein [Verrucomicrobiae bacterium]|nr:zinc ribbon domain-containing protein [Verrucomicrobiae bacterium]
METLLFIPPDLPKAATAIELKASSLIECNQCGHPISPQAVLCMNCGSIPSLFRVGWYVICIMGAMSIITGIIGAAIWAVNNCINSMPK